MLAPLATDWKELLKEELSAPYFKNLSHFIEEEYSNNQCFPSKEKIFAALNNCAFEDVKVVIIGQDPYHKPNLANGLCFSVNSGMPAPASLKNIFTELGNDLNVIPPVNGNLFHWAKQGVLLLNATLSVRVHKAGSHQKEGWEQFTDAIIECISKKEKHVVFMLWGGYAKKKGAKINNTKHTVLESGHPSPLSANRGYWFGNKHFTKCNTHLETHNQSPIQWV